MKKKMKRQIFVIVPVIALALAGAFLYASSMRDHDARNIAESYVYAWNTGKTQGQFTQDLKQITDSHFQDKDLKPAVSGYLNGIKVRKAHIQRIFIIDRHSIGEQASVYYTDVPSKELLQANIVLFRTSQGLKIHEAEIMHRSSAAIPTSAAQVEHLDTVRYLFLEDLVKKWTESMNTFNEKKYLSYFSSSAPLKAYKAAFQKAQQKTKDKHLKYSIVSTGILVLSSTDMEADIVDVNRQTLNGISRIVPLHLRMALDKGSWKIREISSGEPLS